MNQAYRHGEVLLLRIEKIPKLAKKTRKNVFAVGSHNHKHSVSNGNIYEAENQMYLEARDTSLLHPEHSPKIGDAKIEDGFYKLIIQTEYTPDGLIPIID